MSNPYRNGAAEAPLSIADAFADYRAAEQALTAIVDAANTAEADTRAALSAHTAPEDPEAGWDAERRATDRNNELRALLGLDAAGARVDAAAARLYECVRAETPAYVDAVEAQTRAMTGEDLAAQSRSAMARLDRKNAELDRTERALAETDPEGFSTRDRWAIATSLEWELAFVEVQATERQIAERYAVEFPPPREAATGFAATRYVDERGVGEHLAAGMAYDDVATITGTHDRVAAEVPAELHRSDYKAAHARVLGIHDEQGARPAYEALLATYDVLDAQLDPTERAVFRYLKGVDPSLISEIPQHAHAEVLDYVDALRARDEDASKRTGGALDARMTELVAVGRIIARHVDPETSFDFDRYLDGSFRDRVGEETASYLDAIRSGDADRTEAARSALDTAIATHQAERAHGARPLELGAALASLDAYLRETSSPIAYVEYEQGLLMTPNNPAGVRRALEEYNALGRESRDEGPIEGLSRNRLREANLADRDLSGINLEGADLSGANLSGSNLSGANLRGADLAGADLSRANLSGANLDGARLTRAILENADLTGASARGADLAYAHLAGATVTDLDLAAATLYRADLTGAAGSASNEPADARQVLLGPAENPAGRRRILSAVRDYFDELGADSHAADVRVARLGVVADLTHEYIAVCAHSARFCEHAEVATGRELTIAAAAENAELAEAIYHLAAADARATTERTPRNEIATDNGVSY